MRDGATHMHVRRQRLWQARERRMWYRMWCGAIYAPRYKARGRPISPHYPQWIEHVLQKQSRQTCRCVAFQRLICQRHACSKAPRRCEGKRKTFDCGCSTRQSSTAVPAAVWFLPIQQPDVIIPCHHPLLHFQVALATTSPPTSSPPGGASEQIEKKN